MKTVYKYCDSTNMKSLFVVFKTKTKTQFKMSKFSLAILWDVKCCIFEPERKIKEKYEFEE